MANNRKPPRTIAILHPDLGIGGAQQLILKVAQAFDSEQDIDVTIYTSHYDTNHCLQQSKRFNVQVRGTCCGLIPRSCWRKFHAAFSYLKMLLAALSLALFCGQYDVIVIDQISFPIPLLRVLTSAQIVFYCHFPDKLLCVDRRSCFKRLYRQIIDRIQEFSTRYAHKVFVNSKFTQKVFYDTFKSLQKMKTYLLYPCIDFQQFQTQHDNVVLSDVCQQFQGLIDEKITHLITSLNRYEYKKNIKLVLEIIKQLSAQHQFIQMLKNKQIHFCIAGGYDERVNQNVNCYNQLKTYADSIFKSGEAQNYITFLRSINNYQRKILLRDSSILLYTPENQHFGIVPIQAMYNRNIVFGCNSGGPTQTIINNKTGYLIDGGVKQWAAKLFEVIQSNLNGGNIIAIDMKRSAYQHVRSNFSYDSFKKKLLESIFEDDYKLKKQ